ncbi:MAG: hypothetical protein NTY35_17835 [Planctomycetota bacterium]|nr:hypothetical protein [Planctomycetota bacterium]
MFGHPALLLLFWLKLRGGLRLQVRKLRRPSSWVFLIVGGLLVFGWIALMIFGRNSSGQPVIAGNVLRFGVDVGLLVLVVLTLVGAFQYRGLYLPKEEIELAFSAPLERTQLVRYRLGTNLFRSVFAALLFGFLTARRMPVAGYAFTGMFLVMMTVPILGQGVALFLGEGENRIGRLARKAPLKVVSVALGACVGIGVVMLMVSDGAHVTQVLGDQDGIVARLASQPVLRALLLPVAPWGSMVTATSVGEFLPWFALSLGLWIVLYEVTVRAKIDYRELSLATSAEVAKRISMARRGGWAANKSRVTQPAKTSGAPWMFGQGGFGAIAWLETTSMLRRARGTLILSFLLIALLVFLSKGLGEGDGRDPEQDALKNLFVGTMMISLFGTAYLCAGLKFDFRGRLEQMDLVKAWPLAPWRIFLATILPEVLLVSGFLVAAVVGRALWIGAFHPGLVAVVLFQPLVVMTWVALDNAVFLHSPVRYVPGQESALQNMGRSILLMLLRGVVLLVASAVALAPAAGIGFLLHFGLGTTQETAIAVAAGVGWLGILAVDCGLVWAGGKILGRFDVARDRGV